MKKYFLWTILTIVTISLLGYVFNAREETGEKIFNGLFVRAQFDGGGGDGGGGGGMGGQGDEEEDYDIDYADGDCEAAYCYSGRNTEPCPDDLQIKANQQKIVDLRDIMLYLRNRALGENIDFQIDIEKILNNKIKWYEDKIASETQFLNQLEEGAEKILSEQIINILEEEKAKLETERSIKQQLRQRLVELAEVIEELPEPINELTPLPEECLANVRDRCFGICAVGCHDELECAPIACFGGNPCPTWEIGDKVDDIRSVNGDIRAIADQIIRLVESLRAAVAVSPGLPATSTCEDPRQLAQDNNEPYPRKRAASLETLLTCIGNNLGQALPSEGSSNQFYGSLYTYEHTNELCNYARGKTTCGNCAHAVNSCHYGGGAGSDGALAIDFGNEDNGNQIINVALACGAKAARCENASFQTVSCADVSARHIHIADSNCDRI